MKEQKNLDPFEQALLRQQKVEQEALEEELNTKDIEQQWAKISGRLEEKTPPVAAKKAIPTSYLWYAVAALTLLLLLSWGYHFYTAQQIQAVEPVDKEVPAQQLPVELEQAEKAMFANLRQAVEQLQARDTAQWIMPHTLEALEELDEAYQNMKQDLLEDQNGRVLIDAMLANLRLRHQLLEQSVLQLERIQQYSKEQSNYQEL